MTAVPQPAAPDFAAARFNMVENQIRANKVRGEKLLDAFGRLPREMFVPAPLAGIAYIDEDLEVAPGRFLMEPMVLARLIEEAGVKETDRVLDVAPATGYSTAVLAALAKDIIALESDPAMQKRCAENLARLGIGNADVQGGAFAEGWPVKAPYDVILVNGGIEAYPDNLIAQLAEGGRLVFVARLFGPAHAAHKGEARLYEKIRGHVSRRALFDANVRPLPGFRAAAQFVF
ncbi:MAG TPA: protein-L-isoaspartate O-methyltransferase [Alphaproteobacteria bacterium]|nr:protein-L-isoaspartate O-methyltransferase [Alphaproteobacteria bacterium]